jgi:thiazole synthase
MTGTGKHRSVADLLASVEKSGTEIITVAIRRLNLDDPNEKTFLDHLDWDKYQILPNTAGSKTADEAVFTAQLAREVTGSNWIKIEVIPDPKYLLPDPIGTSRPPKSWSKTVLCACLTSVPTRCSRCGWKTSAVRR